MRREGETGVGADRYCPQNLYVGYRGAAAPIQRPAVGTNWIGGDLLHRVVRHDFQAPKSSVQSRR